MTSTVMPEIEWEDMMILFSLAAKLFLINQDTMITLKFGTLTDNPVNMQAVEQLQKDLIEQKNESQGSKRELQVMETLPT